MRSIITVLATLAFIGCADVRREFHYFDDMHYSPAGDTAKLDKYNHKQYDMHEPANTVPYQGEPQYAYKKDADVERASRELKAPANVDLKRGHDKYQIYCAPCHGAQGFADGPVSKKFAGVRPLATGPGRDKAAAEAFPIARIYHVATVGQGLMQGYAPQVQEQDRWNIAAYIKNELQKKK